MLTALTALLTSKKFIASGIALVAQLVGHFGFQADQAALTTALSPLYLYVVGQAVADIGKGKAEVEAATAAKAVTP